MAESQQQAGIPPRHRLLERPRVLGYRSAQVLACVRAHIAADGMAPTYAMICDELGIASRAKVCEVVRRLEQRGLLKRTGTARVRRGRCGLPLSIG